MAARRGVRNDMAAAAATNEPLRTHRAGTRHANCPANQGRIANFKISGGGGIRTRVAGLPQSCFQDSRLRPLGHPSAKCASLVPPAKPVLEAWPQSDEAAYLLRSLSNLQTVVHPLFDHANWAYVPYTSRTPTASPLDCVRINAGWSFGIISFRRGSGCARDTEYIEIPLAGLVTQPI